MQTAAAQDEGTVQTADDAHFLDISQLHDECVQKVAATALRVVDVAYRPVPERAFRDDGKPRMGAMLKYARLSNQSMHGGVREAAKQLARDFVDILACKDQSEDTQKRQRHLFTNGHLTLTRAQLAGMVCGLIALKVTICMPCSIRYFVRETWVSSFNHMSWKELGSSKDSIVRCVKEWELHVLDLRGWQVNTLMQIGADEESREEAAGVGDAERPSKLPRLEP